MSSLIKKFRSSTEAEVIKKSLESSDSNTEHDEHGLSDDQDVDFGGTLAIADDSLISPSDHKDFNYQVPCEGCCSSSSNVTFEIISAEVIREGRSGHVNYTVLINPHNKETSKSPQSVIIRRYSDFEALHHLLKKKFPSLLSNISFPRKVLTGNFTSQTIAKRSTAFEQYLAHLFSFFEIRYSREFMEFFIRDGFVTAVQHYLDKDYSSAVRSFEKVLPVLEKLYGDFHPLVCQCLCALVSCYLNLNKLVVAHTCSEVALRCCLADGSSADQELQIALMLASIRLCWNLGKEKTDLETKVAHLKENGLDVASTKDLQQVLVDTFHLRYST